MAAHKRTTKANPLDLYAIPRARSVDRFKDQIRNLTRRNAPVRLGEVIGAINPIIRGWGKLLPEGECPQALSSAGRVDRTSAVVVHRQAMAERRLPQVSYPTAGDGNGTHTSDQPGAGHHYAPDARAASAQESGLLENCMSRLSERTEAG